MNRPLLISILALFLYTAAPAQQQEYSNGDSATGSYQADPAEERTGTNVNGTTEEQGTDTTLYLNGLHISRDSVMHWKRSKEFAYINNLDSLLKALKDGEKNKPKPKEDSPGILDAFFSSGIVQVLLWAVAACFVLFIIYRLFLSEGAFRRESRSAKTNSAEVEEEEITPDTDFDALIGQALRQQNLRLAVRYQYLRSLHKLAAKQLVELAPDKTNYQYVRELKNPSLQNEFASLTLNYEYVWYGEFAIDKEIYSKIENGFRSFDQKI
mgnify:CR=1 FL=1